MIVMVFCVTGHETLAQTRNIEGVYASVSESEWALSVELKKAGKAVITQESWYPGQYDDRKIIETDATWEWIWEGYELLIHYDGITDTLFYDDRLSLKELGEQGGIPGIYQKFKHHPDSKIKNIKLWTDYHFPCAVIPPQVLVMPEELIEVADKNGYKQIDDFYDFSSAIDPCFVYGYKPTDKWKRNKYSSAVFWCESKREYKYFLLIVSNPGYSGPMKIDDVIEWRWGSHVGGLSLYEDSLATLDDFYYIDIDSTGPKDIKLKDKIIRSEIDGVAFDFYEHNGKWLIRMWD
jgi:hypothetical protein